MATARQLSFLDELGVCNGRMRDCFRRRHELRGWTFWCDTFDKIIADIRGDNKEAYRQLMLAEIELAALSNHPRAVRALERIGKAKGLLTFGIVWTALVVTMPGDDFRRASRGAHRGPSIIKVEGWQ